MLPVLLSLPGLVNCLSICKNALTGYADVRLLLSAGMRLFDLLNYDRLFIGFVDADKSIMFVFKRAAVFHI
jgi:hypothetical protein